MAKTGIQLIAEERQDQIIKHGRTVKQDKELNKKFQLLHAAELLLYLNPKDLQAIYVDDGVYDFSHVCPFDWDEPIFNKMMNKPYEKRLVIAGALIAAEIDRMREIIDIDYDSTAYRWPL